MMGISVERPEIQAEVQGQPVVIPPIVAESISAGKAPWEFRLPLAPDGKPQWLGMNGNEIEACLRGLKEHSRDFRRATK